MLTYLLQNEEPHVASGKSKVLMITVAVNEYAVFLKALFIATFLSFLINIMFGSWNKHIWYLQNNIENIDGCLTSLTTISLEFL